MTSALAKSIIFVMAASLLLRRASSCGCEAAAGLLLIPYLAWLVFAGDAQRDHRAAESRRRNLAAQLVLSDNWG